MYVVFLPLDSGTHDKCLLGHEYTQLADKTNTYKTLPFMEVLPSEASGWRQTLRVRKRRAAFVTLLLRTLDSSQRRIGVTPFQIHFMMMLMMVRLVITTIAARMIRGQSGLSEDIIDRISLRMFQR